MGVDYWTIGKSLKQKTGPALRRAPFSNGQLVIQRASIAVNITPREHSQARSDDADRKDAQDDLNGLDALFVQGDAGKGRQQGQQTGEDRIEQILQDNLRTTHVKGQSSGQ